LRLLRKGDFRPVLAEATAGNDSIVQAPIVITCTGTYWRNSWKYRSRTYRHFGWDNGTILANMLAAASALGLQAKIVCGFVDAKINALLDVDADREVAFSMVALGQGQASSAPPPKMSPLDLPLVPYSQSEVDYPAMRQMHQASSLISAQEVTEWRTAQFSNRNQLTKNSIPLGAENDSQIAADPIEQVILRRGSTRQFSRDPITLAQLSTILYRATRGIPADFLNPSGASLNQLYLIVNAVEGLPSGAYVYRHESAALECLKEGDFRNQAAYLGLEQELPGDAAVDVFFLADLKHILDRLGNRGYRAVQLEAGIIGGKLYLASYAHRIGATGLTFYDDDVVRFFSPHAKGLSAIFLVAIGKSVRAMLRE
jgi:SagB-type dehydrogenase family enzyme